MAKSIHVKANKPWKRIEIPKAGFDDNAFDGLVDLQELTDYEFINPGKKNKKRKATDDDAETDISDSKKKKIEVEVLSSEKDNVKTQWKIEELSSDKDSLKKKKKGKSRKKKIQPGAVDDATDNVDGSRLEDISGSVSVTEESQKTEQNNQIEGSKKKKGKSRKKKTAETCDNDIENKNGDNLSDNIEVLDGEKIGDVKKTKKVKFPKRKRKTPTENLDAPGQSDVSIEEEKVMKNSKLDMSKWSNLFVHKTLLKSLQEQGFQNPTTIQTLTLPSAIRDFKDILAAAETGSGKTLAFGIPVVGKVLAQKECQGEENPVEEESVKEHDSEIDDDGDDSNEVDMESDKESDDNEDEVATQESPDVESEGDNDDNENDDFDFNEDLNEETNHVSKPPQVLILEPTRELAVQVHKHLSKLAKYTDINFATVVGGMSVEKQRRLLKRLPEVIIATPGRLWQLIEEGDEHLSQMDLIHSLVVDEADRMVERGHYEELTRLLEMINKSPRRDVKRQSFVMSATLTMEVNTPKRLMNKKKKKNDMENDKLNSLTKKICLGTKPKVFDLTPKDKTAKSLTEMRINCALDEKDYYLFYFLTQHPGRTLVFANSKDCLRRLVSVFNLLQCNPFPLHADMQQRQRLKNLDRFSENSKGVLLASDVAARGLDIPNVDYVIHYQVPLTKENYVHRSGRTARASNVGLSVMLVAPEEARNYRKIVQGVKNGEDVPLLPYDPDLLPAVKNRVNLARSIDVAEYRSKKVKLHNDFFTKAAEEMDMIVDEKDLVPMDDVVIQAEDKNILKGMRYELSTMLKGSLAPLRMTKYPTKSGKLLSMKSIDLLQAS